MPNVLGTPGIQQGPPRPAPIKICGNCRWHHALAESHERIGWKNCLALPYPNVTEFYSIPSAPCTFPHLFEPPPPTQEPTP